MAFHKPKQGMVFPDRLDVEINKAQFTYYDREKKERKVIALPFKFVVLDTRFTIKGWSEPRKRSIISNEIESFDETFRPFFQGNKNKQIKSEPLDDGRKGELEGLWSEIKMLCQAQGAHLNTVLYGISESGKLLRVYLSGAPLSAWINKGFNHEIEQCGIQVAAMNTYKNGQSTCCSPVFDKWELSEEMCAKATEESIALEKFFAEYKEFKANKNKEKEPDPARDDDAHDKTLFDDPNDELQEEYVTQGGEQREEEIPF